MNKSESIAELAKALNLAQSEMSGAKKKAANPFFKSKYANLEEVIHCIKEPFSNNGLSYVQFPVTEEGKAGVETILMHNSGEWISSSFVLKVAKNDPQGMGSAITYARRYGLQSAVGVPSEDDDGNMASKPAPKKAEPIKVCSNEDVKTFLDKMREHKLYEFISDKELNDLVSHPSFAIMDHYKKECVARSHQMTSEAK